MDSENEKLLNFYRGFTRMLDDTAGEPYVVSDGIEATDEDREAARECAASFRENIPWLRRHVLFTSTPPAYRSDHDDSQIFDDDKLREELNEPEGERREAAIAAYDALATLAERRAFRLDLGYEAVRADIYNRRQLWIDLRSPDENTRKRAHSVIDTVAHVAALREVAIGETTVEMRATAARLVKLAHEKLNEMRIADGEPVVNYQD